MRAHTSIQAAHRPFGTIESTCRAIRSVNMVEKFAWPECVGMAVLKVYRWPTDLSEPEVVSRLFDMCAKLMAKGMKARI